MNILGISGFYHDSAAALIQNGKILAAAQEERFSRIKHDASFPRHAIKFCLDYADLKPSDLDCVAFYEKPFIKFERLLETYYAFAPRGLPSFIRAMPVWLQEKLFIRKIILKELAHLYPSDFPDLPILFPEHHLSHAASAFYPSPFSESAILVADGVGEWATATLGFGKHNQIIVNKELCFPHSVGLLYSSFTYFLGFKVNSGEFKLMGLAPYGNLSDIETKKFIHTIQTELIDLRDDGSVWLNPEYFSYATHTHMIHEKKWENLFGFKKRKEGKALEQKHCNMARAIQHVTEEILFRMAREAKKLTGSSNLCMAGGVALNCVFNGKLQQSGLFNNIFIQPAAGDAGGALGAALAAYYIFKGMTRNPDNKKDEMQGSYLGPEFTDKYVEQRVINKFGAQAMRFHDEQELLKTTAGFIQEGKVVGWFQGRMEFGPRALGNRSILADPRRQDMIRRLNLTVKRREEFRPFAPAVIAEDAEKYFDIDRASPYMLLVTSVKKERCIPMPSHYEMMSLHEKLYLKKSDIPAVTHVDFSARIQTVEKESNPRFYGLLMAFKELTGCSVLINTSFNVRGEPPVCKPEEAYSCFMKTDMDYLVINSYIFSKADQPPWHDDNMRFVPHPTV